MFKRLFFYSACAFLCSIFTAVILLDAKYVDIRIQEEKLILDGIFTVITNQAKEGPITDEVLNDWSGRFGYKLSVFSQSATALSSAEMEELRTEGCIIKMVSGWTQDSAVAHYIYGEQILKMSKMHVDKQAYLIYWQFLLVTIFFVLALFVYAYVYMHKKYIQKLLLTYETYGQGDLTARVSDDMPAPYSVLSSHFNKMAEKIESLLEEHQHMLNGISHDLKTPLARLRFALDMTRNSKSVEEYRDSIVFMDEDLDALDELLDDWFLYVGLNAARKQPKLVACQLDSILLKVINRSVPAYSILTAHSHIATDITVSADIKLLTRAIENIVSNACKFAKSSIRVSTQYRTKHIAIIVEDDGVGIPSDKRDAVLKPFHRLDSSRHIPGLGLGLSIVKSILSRHDGKLEISDSELGGAKVTFFLPILSGSKPLQAQVNEHGDGAEPIS